MTHDLELTIVAEGVEDSEQLLWLLRVGCGFVQGYLISPPVSASTIGDRLGCNKATTRIGPSSSPGSVPGSQLALLVLTLMARLMSSKILEDTSG